MKKDTPKVFTPAKIGAISLRNRTIRSAAFEGMSPGGLPSQSLIDYHRSVAAGGVGMTTVAYVSVARDGRTFSHQMWMRPEILPGLRRLTDAVHAEGACASVQLGHCGNMSDKIVAGGAPVAPSRVFNLFGLALPRRLAAWEIGAMVRDFAAAVRLAREAGFDAVEIQAGHGYLISQFLSPYTNRRTDAWGGPLRNRARFMLSVVRAAREAAGGSMSVLVKMNLRDGFKGGMELDEAVEAASMLEQAGADALVLSGGFVSRCPMYIMRGETPLKDMAAAMDDPLRRIGLVLFGGMMVRSFPFKEAYFLDDAMAVRQAVRLPLVLVGGLRSLHVIEEVLGRGFDFVAMARALIREPDFVARLKRGAALASKCDPCNKCMASMYVGESACPPAAGIHSR
ncbi:MAG: NADH:flavin oxidoreductase [Pseudomonadota bacterium]